MIEALLCLLIALCLLFAAAVIILHTALFTNRKSRLFSKFARNGRDPAFQAYRDQMRVQMERTSRTEYTLISSRGERLLGYYYPCGDKPCGKIAIMVHGLGSNHTAACGMHCEYYRKRGFDVFCCENQGMKRRRGKYVGYGIFEGDDVLDWIRYWTEQCGEDVCFILHGFSMGASSLLRICDRCPAQVRFTVSDSGFSDADRLLAARLHMLYPPIRLWNRIRLGYDMKDTDVTGAVRNSRVPILFVHGDADHVVPFAMGQELYAACGTDADHLWVAGADHVESRYRAAEAYDEKLDDFLARYVCDVPKNPEF